LALARQSKWEDAWPLLVAARANMIEAKVSEHPLFNNVLRALVKCAEETNRTAEKFQYESELPKPPPTTQP